MFWTSTEVAKRTGLSFRQVQELVAARKSPTTRNQQGKSSIGTPTSPTPSPGSRSSPWRGSRKPKNIPPEGVDDAFEEEKERRNGIR